jgi:hypothetical protein
LTLEPWGGAEKMQWKDPAVLLTNEDIRELIREDGIFDNWLKYYKKISNYDYASYDRRKRREKLREIIDKTGDPTLSRVYDVIIAEKTQSKDTTTITILQDIQEFLEQELGVVIKRKPETEGEEIISPVSEEEEQIREETEPQEWIGRVAPTLTTPTTPSEFTFWLVDDENIHMEIGNIVTAHNQDIRVTGIVTDIQAVSDIREVVDSFYGHAFGRPDVEMPTRIPVIMSAKVEVVHRNDGKMEPIRGAWPVTFASASEIRKAYGARIEEEVLAGFTHDGRENPVPIVVDARYVVGYEAAHINISGASGVATKTSYALFLLYGLLDYSERYNGGIAAIAFNVKEADLMFIDDLPEWEDLEKLKNHPRWERTIRLWKQAKKEYGVDPIRWAKEGHFRFFAPMHYHTEGGVLSQRRDEVEAFSYSLQSLIKVGVGALYALFDPDDLDERAVALIASMVDEAKPPRNLNFDELINELRRKMRQGQGDWFDFGGSTHHRATANKILNRLQYALENQLKGIVRRSENDDNHIPIEELKPGQLWIIDITQLSEKGQRLIFQTVVRTVFQKLEERKTAEITGRWKDSTLQEFPKHVVIFVDELNKFVPSGREFSVLKKDIVEIAARGRSVGFSLLGAQQLASKVDEEVLANTSTFAVGRSHPVEIHKPPYGWLAEGLKQKATILDKGWMLLWHTLFNRPVLVHFPLPLHHLKKELERAKR